MEKDEFLQVIDLHKSFHGTEVLKGITTGFARNEVVSIIGAASSLTGWISAQKSRTSTCTGRRWGWCSSSSIFSIMSMYSIT